MPGVSRVAQARGPLITTDASSENSGPSRDHSIVVRNSPAEVAVADSVRPAAAGASEAAEARQWARD